MAAHLILKFAGWQISSGLGKYGVKPHPSQCTIIWSRANQNKSYIFPWKLHQFYQINPNKANQTNGLMQLMKYIPELLIIIALHVWSIHPATLPPPLIPPTW